eukprot:Rmarinus@m.22673
MGALHPPVNFGMVEEDLFRSGHPNSLNFPFLEKLHLRKVLYLASQDPSPDFQNFLTDQDIELVRIGFDSEDKDPLSPISEDAVIQALHIILDTNNYPLMIMCTLGRHRTGTVCGCLRKLQRWNLTSIFEEYHRYAGNIVRLLNEQFIELFDTDLVTIPQEAPPFPMVT